MATSWPVLDVVLLTEDALLELAGTSSILAEDIDSGSHPDSSPAVPLGAGCLSTPLTSGSAGCRWDRSLGLVGQLPTPLQLAEPGGAPANQE